jgi:hypothetical protein
MSGFLLQCIVGCIFYSVGLIIPRKSPCSLPVVDACTYVNYNSRRVKSHHCLSLVKHVPRSVTNRFGIWYCFHNDKFCESVHGDDQVCVFTTTNGPKCEVCIDTPTFSIGNRNPGRFPTGSLLYKQPRQPLMYLFTG